MALFRGTNLYGRNVDQDQSWGTKIMQLSGTSGTDSTWTMTYTSTTLLTETMVPYTNTTASSTNDTRTSNGWALNQSATSNDGMGSTSTAKRLIPSGNWSFSCNISYSAPALLASYTIQAEFSVYRVSASNVLTLLFSTTSNTITATLLSGSDTLSASISQSEYLIEAGETIHFAVRIISKATSSLLGGTTNTVITISAGTAGYLAVTIPSPGLRIYYYMTNNGVSSGVSLRSNLVKTSVMSLLSVVSNISKLSYFYKVFTSAVEFTGIFLRNLSLYRSYQSKIDLTASKYLIDINKDYNSTFKFNSDLSRSLDLHRSFNAISNYISYRQLEVKTTVNSLISNVPDINKSVIFVRNFDATVDDDVYFNKVVIFVREFNGTFEFTVRPRICLDWDDLPDSGEIIIIEDTSQKTYFDWE